MILIHIVFEHEVKVYKISLLLVQRVYPNSFDIGADLLLPLLDVPFSVSVEEIKNLLRLPMLVRHLDISIPFLRFVESFPVPGYECVGEEEEFLHENVKEWDF